MIENLCSFFALVEPSTLNSSETNNQITGEQVGIQQGLFFFLDNLWQEMHKDMQSRLNQHLLFLEELERVEEKEKQ